MFEFAKRGFGLYVAHFPAYTMIYGAFAIFPLALLWMYFSWVIVLFGATLTASMLERMPP
jgi:membrane protein